MFYFSSLIFIYCFYYSEEARGFSRPRPLKFSLFDSKFHFHEYSIYHEYSHPFPFFYFS